MNENRKWLEETGYTFNDDEGRYVFEYKNGDYGVFNWFDLTHVVHAPLEHIKYVHHCFLEKAEKKELF